MDERVRQARRALGADLLDRGGFQDMLRASADPDALKALRGGIHGLVSMYAAYGDVLRALHSMAQLDAEAVAGAVERMEQGRAQGMADLAQRLAAQQILRPGVTAGQAADLLWVLTSFESFDLLYTDRALPTPAIAKTLISIAERTLCK
jgi:hypothetical protein